MTIKRVGNSTEPKFYQLKAITENLRERLGVAVNIHITHWAYESSDSRHEFKLFLIPGLNGEECYVSEHDTWESLLSYYRELMRVKG